MEDGEEASTPTEDQVKEITAGEAELSPRLSKTQPINGGRVRTEACIPPLVTVTEQEKGTLELKDVTPRSDGEANDLERKRGSSHWRERALSQGSLTDKAQLDIRGRRKPKAESLWKKGLLRRLLQRFTDRNQHLTTEEEAQSLVDQLNVIMLAQYWISQAFKLEHDVENPTRKPYAVASACLWTVVAAVLAFLEIACLLSLGVSVNWPRCVTSDDCNAGQACARLYETCAFNTSENCPFKPVCVDCNHLAGAENGGSGEPWMNDFLPGGAAYYENATVFCVEDQLLAPEHAHFLPGAWDDMGQRPLPPDLWSSSEGEGLSGGLPPSFAHCLYARKAGVSMTTTDTLILHVVFLLVAMEVAAETREHANAYHLRRLLLPWKPLQRTAVSVCYSACRLLITLLGFLYSKAVRRLSQRPIVKDPCTARCAHSAHAVSSIRARWQVVALIPYACLALLTSQGTDATSIVLNGLTVIFVLELDNRIPQVFVSLAENDMIKDTFRDLFTAERRRLKELIRQDPMCRETFRTILDQYPNPRLVTVAASSVCYASLISGFNRATGPLSNISCEMLVHFYFYRIALQFGIWWTLLGQICGDLSSYSFDVITTVASHYKAGRGGVVLRFVAYAVYELAIWPFTGALVTGFCLTAAYAFVNLMYWPPMTSLDFRMHFPGFFLDVFGLCAASGYAEYYVLDCIPLSAGVNPLSSTTSFKYFSALDGVLCDWASSHTCE